ncbi:methyltransferase family protein [Pragia fontium]|uniref:methyltransferase family protein n=1 Tax=Pragia fontium TaxID=82985 RepID=UPI001915C7D4|nr:isoprenylcysteine carboxylmethyltransferase family protein [Pragia fontium]
MSLSYLELRIPPPIIFMISLLLIALLNWLLPVNFPQTTLFMALCGVSFLASGLIGLISLRAFIRVKTTVNPIKVQSASTLVVNGLYGFSRNPMYLALALLLLSVCLYLANPWTALGVLFFVLFITRFQIIPEEKALTEEFGERYQAYRKRVRRWL